MLTIEVVRYLLQLHFREIPEPDLREKLAKFTKWMYGQTVSEAGGEKLYYLTDVIRFLNGLTAAD